MSDHVSLLRRSAAAASVADSVPGGLGRREENKRQTRLDILISADRIMAERGIKAAHMRAIAASAGVSYQTLYHYFPSKAHLVEGLLAEQLARVLLQIEQHAAAQTTDLVAALKTVNRLRLDAVRERDLERWQAVPDDFLWRQQGQRDKNGQPLAAAANVLRHLLTLARDQGRLHAASNIELLAAVIFELQEYALWSFAREPAADRSQALARLNEKVLLVLSAQLQEPDSVAG